MSAGEGKSLLKPRQLKFVLKIFSGALVSSQFFQNKFELPPSIVGDL